MNLKLILSIFAGLIAIISFAPYFLDIIHKKTKPHAYTWLIWTITQGTALAGLWLGVGGWGFISLFIGTGLIFIIFLLSLKYGTRNITKGDTITLIAALIAILIWWQLHNPLLAILMVSLIDFLGYIPSFRKTYKNPWTETPIFWILSPLAYIVTILALDKYNLLTLTYLITVTVADITLLMICLIRRKSVKYTNSN
jgi:hypothetical protein